MRQSNIIFGVLLLAFVMFVTIRGQLPEYLSIFTGAATGGSNTPASNNNSDIVDGAIKNMNDTLSNMGIPQFAIPHF